MRKIQFDREAARILLSERYCLDKRTIDLILLRSEFLVRNELFIKDVENLRKLKNDSDDYRNHSHELRKKWCVNDYGLYDKLLDTDPIVITGRDITSPIPDQYHIRVTIDLRYSKKKIVDTIKREVEKWHDDFWRRVKEGLYYCEEINEANEPPEKLAGNLPSDLDDYDRYLKVWDLRELEHKSWKEIQKELEVSFDTARNWHKRACNLVLKGIPGFPPFPQE